MSWPLFDTNINCLEQLIDDANNFKIKSPLTFLLFSIISKVYIYTHVLIN